MSLDLADVQEMRVPSQVLSDGYEFMRAAGRMKLEGLVLWAGRQLGTVFEVTNLIIPRQRALSTPDGVCAIVDSPELSRINMLLYRSELKLAAQVHTHPTNAYHSKMDDENAIANTIGSFSIVVPNFARQDYPLSECAVYRLDALGRWLEVDESQLPNKIMALEA